MNTVLISTITASTAKVSILQSCIQDTAAIGTALISAKTTTAIWMRLQKEASNSAAEPTFTNRSAATVVCLSNRPLQTKMCCHLHTKKKAE